MLDATRVRLALRLRPGRALSVLTVTLSFEVHGSAIARDPLRAARLAHTDGKTRKI